MPNFRASPTLATSERSYDGGDRLISIVNKSGNATISSFNYTLNAVGNRTQVSDNTGTTTFAYDNLHRLTSVTYPGGPTDTYTYDAVGNRLAKNGTTYIYDNADQMTNAGSAGYSYDANGNQTSRAGDSFAWDHENRLTSAWIASAQTTYAYNGDGLRMSRTSGGQTTNYVWDVGAGSLPVILQDGTNTYVYGPTGLLYWVDSSGNPTYRLPDGLGSTVGLTDASGNITATWTYDVFGAVKTHTGANTDFTFTGEQNDPNGLEYLRARYYDPAIGRFLGRDPMGGGYTYAKNNPANLIDPSGLYAICGDDPTWGYICFDSTQVGLPACDVYGACYIWTPDGTIGLAERFGDACVFANAAVANCVLGQFDVISPADSFAAATFAQALATYNAFVGMGISGAQIEDAQRTLRQLSMCLRYGNACNGTLSLEMATMCDSTRAAAGGTAAVAGLLIFGITALDSRNDIWWETLFGVGAHFAGIYAVAQSGCL